MEFEKIKKIISEVLNVDAEEITMEIGRASCRERV